MASQEGGPELACELRVFEPIGSGDLRALRKIAHPDDVEPAAATVDPARIARQNSGPRLRRFQ